jgi:hypothetical protein
VDQGTSPTCTLYNIVYDPANLLKYTNLTGYKNAEGNPAEVAITDPVTGVVALKKPQELSDTAFVENFEESWADKLVELHPEYCVYKNIEPFKASLDWETDFKNTDTYAAALAKGYLNPAGNSAINFTQNMTDPIYGLLNDPAKATELQNAIFNLNFSDGNASQSFNLWGFSCYYVKCLAPFTGSINANNILNGQCLTTWTNPTNIFNTSLMCEGDLNMAWQIFRDQYISKKRNWLIQYAKDKCASNNTSYTYLPLMVCKDVLNNRPGNEVFVQGDGSTAPTSISSATTTANAAVAAEVADNCNGYKESWRASLTACGTWTTQQLDNIIEQLVAVCNEGGDVNHILGASTVKPKSVYPYRSFDEVITALRGLNNPNCNGYLITTPLPYEQPLVVDEKPIITRPDSCECAKVTMLHTEYTNVANQYTNFSSYLKLKYQTEVRQTVLDSLLGLCNNPNNNCNFLVAPLFLPPLLQCNIEPVCIDCKEAAKYYAKYKTKFPAKLPTIAPLTSIDSANNVLFANYMNANTGFGYNALNYLSFIDTCNKRATLQGVDLNACEAFTTVMNSFKQQAGGMSIQGIAGAAGNGSTTTNYTYPQLNKNGVLTLPTPNERTLPVNTIAFAPINDSICLQDTMSVSFRFRSKAPFINIDESLVLNFNAFERPITFNRSVLNNINYTTQTIGSFKTGVLGLANYAGWDDWNTVKIVFRKGYYDIYYNNEFVADELITAVNKNVGRYVKNFNIKYTNNNFELDWLRIANKNDVAAYNDNFDNPLVSAKPNSAMLCVNTNCEAQFAQLYNTTNATSLTYTQIAALYTTICGGVLNVCGGDTTNCNQLKALQTQFYNAYIAPSTRYVDLDMRTFAGNKTPAKGPKGVFNINKVFIGQTVDGTAAQINASYAQLWNSNAANSAVGSLTALANGKFRLQLNTGQTVPCDGVIGMRFYKVDVEVNETHTVNFGAGRDSYVDFGDGTTMYTTPRKVLQEPNDTAVIIQPGLTMYEAMAGNVIGQSTYYLPNFPAFRAMFLDKEYTYAANNIFRTITVYHTDVKGFLRFGSDTSLLNLRGYLPERIGLARYEGTNDSTLSNMKLVANWNDIKQLSAVQLLTGYVNGSTVLKHTKLPSLEKKKLQHINFNPLYFAVDEATYNSIVGSKLYEMLPDIPNKFPDLNDMTFSRAGWAEKDFAQMDFGGKNITVVDWTRFANSVSGSQYVDSMLIQMDRGNQFDGSYKSIYAIGNLLDAAPPMAPTTASAAARASLISRGYILYGIDPNAPAGAPGEGIYDYDKTNVTNHFTEYVNSQLHTNYSYTQLVALYKNKCGQDPNWCTAPPPVTLAGADLKLCGKRAITAILPEEGACADSLTFAYYKATDRYTKYKDSLKGSFEQAYIKNCLRAIDKNETFTLSRPAAEYHYTLYYYDQAGNLVKTLPPAAVVPDYALATLTSVKNARIAGTDVFIITHNDSLATKYRYNSLNQVIAQRTPDAGISNFWYDRLGRLVVSQNEQQRVATNIHYSYTLYDDIGRITEVGQKKQTTVMTQVISRNQTSLLAWINAQYLSTSTQVAEQVTYTKYDEVIPTSYVPAAATTTSATAAQNSKTLRNRVSHTLYYDVLNNTTTTSGIKDYAPYTTGTIYNYDIHGNVNTLWQDYKVGIMATKGQRIKQTNYYYDLISGKVNQVHYQSGFYDQYFHRYLYDAENRLTDVYTATKPSFVGIELLEEREAKYNYYKHGPMSRTELGQLNIQGVDYAYTIQGWLKGVNSTGVDPTITAAQVGVYDMGGDGKTGGVNIAMARDVYSYQLNYFEGDYKTINGLVKPFVYPLAFTGNRNLYNGNITSMAVSIPKVGNTNLYNYKYDQLNRIVEMDAYSGYAVATNSFNTTPTVSTLTLLQDYKERVAYDANGNIETYFRNGSTATTGGGSGLAMDNLTYNYSKVGGKLQNNRLLFVTDQVTTNATYTQDIKTQTAANYRYDQIGNLTYDRLEKIDSVYWTVYGKISRVAKATTVTTGQPDNITYTYDASGNRISKFVHKKGVTLATSGSYTWYASLEGDPSLSANAVALTEHHVYGSSRVAVHNKSITTEDANNTQPVIGKVISSTFIRGNKFFELVNHLGNVLVTISDRKVQIQNGTTGNVAYYEADVVTASDYYPGGMELPGRNFTATTSYRYSINGQEKTPEIAPNTTTAMYWEYDSRIMRRWNVDPVLKTWESPYMCFSGNPIMYSDRNGDDPGDGASGGIGGKLKKKSGSSSAPAKATAVARVDIPKPQRINPNSTATDGNKPVTAILIPPTKSVVSSYEYDASRNESLRRYANEKILISEVGNKNSTDNDNYLKTKIINQYKTTNGVESLYKPQMVITSPPVEVNLQAVTLATPVAAVIEHGGNTVIDAWNGNYKSAAINGGLFFLDVGAPGSSKVVSAAGEVASVVSKEVSIFKHTFKYADRVRMRGIQDPVSHNFPYSFDDVILSTTPILKNNGYKMFQQAGSMNGKNGVFEIGLNSNNIIDHRFFRPVK